MKVTLKAGCDLSFTRMYCPQAIEEYEQWGFVFDKNGINVPTMTEMNMDEITALVKFFTHREMKYDLSPQNLSYAPNAPYYPGSCLIQVTKFNEGPGARYWAREKYEVEYYIKFAEETHGPQEDKWYITVNDEDKELTPEEYEIQSPKSDVFRHTFEPVVFVPPSTTTNLRSSMTNIMAMMSDESIERLFSITNAAFPELSMWQTSNRLIAPPNSPTQPRVQHPQAQHPQAQHVYPNSIWSIDSQYPRNQTQF